MVLQAWLSITSDPGKPMDPGFGKRHIFALMAFAGICISYAMRFNLSIAIVVMVKSRHPRGQEVNRDGEYVRSNRSLMVSTESCPVIDSGNSSNVSLNARVGDFDWDESTVGFVLGSFFWGYTVTMFPGGLLAQRFGGKWPFGIAQLLSALAGMLIPVAAYAGPKFLAALRIFQGLFGGCTVPACHLLIAKWISPKERGRFVSFIYTGMPLGSAATLIISGYLAQYMGWASVFYITGVVALIWTGLWFWLIYETPSVHPTISEEEYNYIEGNLADQRDTNVEKLKTPWREIFTSIPFWAILICHPASTWGHYTFLILLPTYLKTALHFDPGSNSWISAFPHIASWLSSMILVRIGDMLQDRNILSTGAIRKINMTIALVGSAFCMLGVAFAGCDYKLAVTLLILAAACIGGVYAGVFCNHIDIAPNFAGVLLGISNTLATMPGFLSPSIAGYILRGDPSVSQWRKVFYLGAAVHFVGNIFYALFASGEVQPWNAGTRAASPNAVIDVIG